MLTVIKYLVGFLLLMALVNMIFLGHTEALPVILLLASIELSIMAHEFLEGMGRNKYNAPYQNFMKVSTTKGSGGHTYIHLPTQTQENNGDKFVDDSPFFGDSSVKYTPKYASVEEEVHKVEVETRKKITETPPKVSKSSIARVHKQVPKYTPAMGEFYDHLEGEFDNESIHKEEVETRETIAKAQPKVSKTRIVRKQEYVPAYTPVMGEFYDHLEGDFDNESDTNGEKRTSQHTLRKEERPGVVKTTGRDNPVRIIQTTEEDIDSVKSNSIKKTNSEDTEEEFDNVPDIKGENGLNVTENKLFEAMKAIGLIPRYQYRISKMKVDFAFPEQMVVIEINGPHHNTPEFKMKDDRRFFALKGRGWKRKTFDSKEVYNNPEAVANRIKRLLSLSE